MALGMRIAYRLPYACQHRRLIKDFFTPKISFIWLSHLLWKVRALPPRQSEFHFSLWRRSNARNVSFLNLSRSLVIGLLATGLIKSNFHFPLSHWRSITVPLESRKLFKLFTACKSGGERNWTLNYANRNGFSLVLCKMKCCKIDERLPFFLEDSILRHDQASNKIFC